MTKLHFWYFPVYGNFVRNSMLFVLYVPFYDKTESQRVIRISGLNVPLLAFVCKQISTLAAFAKLRKAAFSFVIFCPSLSLRMVHLSALTGRIFMKFDAQGFANLSRKINPLTPNDHFSGRTAPLTSKHCILYIYSTNIGTEYFKHGKYSPFFFLFKMQFV